MDIATKLTDLTTDLRACRQAITEKGGTISANAGFAEVADKILEIPSGTTSVGTVINDSISVFKQVPANSISHCYISKLGGYTHAVPDDSTILAPIRLENAKPTAIRVHGVNLIPFPYRVGSITKDVGYSETVGGITFTIMEDRGVKAVGTATGASNSSFEICDINFAQLYGECSRSGCVFNKNTGVTSVSIKRGTTVDTVIYPMTNFGSTGLPYTPYREPITYTLPESITSLTNLGLGLYDNEYNECDFVNGKYIQRCNTKTFVGTETFTKSTVITRSRFSVATPVDCRYWRGASGSLANQKCDYFGSDASIDQLNGDDTIMNKGTQWQQNWYWYVSSVDFPDLETWKAYIAEHPMELVYELEMEKTEELNMGGFNPLIEVEGGGSIEFITDSGYAPNSTVVFQTIL